MRLELGRNVPVDIRSDALVPQPLALLPLPHRVFFYTKPVGDKKNILRLHLSPMLLWFLALHNSEI